MSFLRTVLLLLVLVGLLLPAAPAGADQGVERILLFSSRIRVDPDSSVTVTETIQVNCRREEIKRGIVRAFPTTYINRFHKRVTVRFEVTEVTRDGRPEPYHLEKAPNGIRIFVGRSDVFLDAGEYTYTLTYVTDRQLGYFDTFDELYWNVTGSQWSLPIDRAEAEIELPAGARVLEHSGYTGPDGATGNDYQADQSGGNRMAFSTTRPLKPYEGLTVAVSWPKGLVQQPSTAENLGTMLKDNAAAIAGLCWFVFLLLYYFAAWLAVGRDPARGTVIPLFEPPKGLSPAAMRFVHRMGFDHKTFAAAVVNLAVKGKLTIKEKDKVFTVRKISGSGNDGLSRGEKKVLDKLLAGRAAITLKNTNHKTISGAMNGLKSSLRDECEKVYFVVNRAFFFPGLALTLLAVLSIVLMPPIRPEALFISLWLSIWSFGVFFMVLKLWRLLRDAITRREGRVAALIQALVLGAFLTPFLGGEVVGLAFFARAVSPAATVALAGILLLNVLFYQLLKAPTPVGRKLMDRIEGFRLFLSVAEKERLEFLHPPDRTPELFERYLPHAMALDVENQWSEQFEKVLAVGPEESGAWSPSWYSGRSWTGLNTSSFASGLGSSFSGAIASSSTAPGSSSGSGGGGSSGGGGGGGGGGGW